MSTPITTVTGASWPTSGTANAASIGVFAVTGTLTHVGASSSDLWPGASSDGATGYVKCAAGVAATLRIDNAAAGTGAGGAKYNGFVWVRFSRVTKTLPNQTDSQTYRLSDHLGGGGGQIINTMALRKRATAPEHYSGVCMSQAAFNVGGPTASEAQYTSLNPVIPFDRWVKLGWFIKKGAAGTAEYGWTLNGQVFARFGTAADAIGTLSLSGYSDAQLDAHTLQFPNWTDVEVHLGKMVTASGTGCVEYTDAPASTYAITPSNYDLAFHWPAGFLNTGAQEGANWAWTNTSGTPTIAITPYASGGTHLWRRFATVTEAAVNNVGYFLSARPIGTLPYNAEGWASIVFPMVMVHGTASMTIDVLASNDTTVLGRIGFTASGFTYDNGTGTTDKVSFNSGADIRYAVIFHYNSDGRAKITIVRMTDDVSGNGWYSLYPMSHTFAVDDWTPATLGRLKVSCSVPAANDYCHFDGAAVCRYITIGAVDSYTQANSNTASPTMSCCNTRSLLVQACLREGEAGSGGGYFIPIDPAHPVPNFVFSGGWSGHKGLEYFSRNGMALAAAPGFRHVIMGGIVNDLNAYASSASNAQFYGQRWGDSLLNFAQAAVAAESHVMILTPFTGTGAAFVQTDAPAMMLTGVNRVRSGIRQRFDPRGRVIYHETSTSITSGSDGIHQDEAQAAAWWSEVSKGMQVLNYVARKRRVPA